jgi:hypothetical protein
MPSTTIAWFGLEVGRFRRLRPSTGSGFVRGDLVALGDRVAVGGSAAAHDRRIPRRSFPEMSGSPLEARAARRDPL